MALETQAPGSALASLDDPKTTFTKASFQGRYLLVDFWGTWCGYCVRDLPTPHKVHGPDGTILAKGEDLREAKLATTLARFLKK